MKIKLGQVFKKAMPFVRTGISLVKVAKNISTGNPKGALKGLKQIQKRGDLKKMVHIASDEMKKKKKKT